MQGSIETVLFDFGGTLDADGVAWKERFYAHYCAEGLKPPLDLFQSSFFAADDALIGKLPPSTDLEGTVHGLVANLELELAHHAGDPNAVCRNGHGDFGRGKRVAARFLSDASATFARNRPVLEALQKRYRLGVVSNFYGNLEAVCRGAGLAANFAALVDSQCVGAKKPDPAIFRAALERLRAKPDTTVFVGDSLRRDREGARRIGMRFIWMAPVSPKAAGGNVPMDSAVEHTVTDLRDVMRVLQ
jgi:beta-phosphoglucomutase-like phosphatase (HAD superfamily)